MPDKTPHIVFLSSYLDVPGGYEKIVVNTANLFVEKQNKVTLLIIDRTTKSYYPVHGKIDIKHLPLSFGITQVGNPITRKATLVKDIFRLRNTLKKLQPTLVISTEHPFAIAAVLGRVQKSTRLISWEHHHYYWLKKNMFWTYLLGKHTQG